MKKYIRYLSVIIIILSSFILCSCDMDDDPEYVLIRHVNYDLERCVGGCLTREEMAQLVYNFEKVKEKWEGKKNGDYTVPELILETPGEHEHDDNTRYSVTLLDTNGQAMHKGIKVSVLEEGRCDTREDDKKGDRWVLVDVSSETNDDVIKSDSSMTFTGDGTEFVTQYDNDFDSTHHASMTFRCTIDEPPAELLPGDELTFHLRADVISEGEPIVNAYMSCNMIVQNTFNPVSDTGANDSENGIYAGGDTFTNMAFMQSMEDTVHITVPAKNDLNDEVFIEFYTSAGSTNWVYKWNND